VWEVLEPQMRETTTRNAMLLTLQTPLQAPSWHNRTQAMLGILQKELTG